LQPGLGAVTLPQRARLAAGKDPPAQAPGERIDHGMGVATAHTFVVKKLDLDYFEEEVG
jgi:hypothetical protein